MVSPVDIGVYEEQKTNKKGVREHYWGCRCCDPSPDCSLKMNHIGYNMQCRSQYSAQLLTNKDHFDVSESEKKRRILNIKTMFLGKDIISLTDNFNLCDDGKNLSNKEKLIKVCNFLGV